MRAKAVTSLVGSVPGEATIVYYKNGTVKIGEWGRDFTMNSSIEGVRQNLKLLIDHGKIVAIDTPEALKASIGKDRVQIQTADDKAAITELAAKFGLEAAMHEGAVTFSVAARCAARGAIGAPANAAARTESLSNFAAFSSPHFSHRLAAPGL